VEERRQATRVKGDVFASQARAAMEKHVSEARTAKAVWKLSPNMAWVRIPRDDGSWQYLGLRRHLDWITGEAAISREPIDLEKLPLWTGAPPADAPGYRIRLGELMHEGDRWWPVDEDERERRERIEWLVLQLSVKSATHFARHPAI
jgi:hypothetical protein